MQRRCTDHHGRCLISNTIAEVEKKAEADAMKETSCDKKLIEVNTKETERRTDSPTPL